MAGGSLGDLVVSLTMQSAQFHSELQRSAASMNTNMGKMAGSVSQLQTAVDDIDRRMGAFGVSMRTMFGMVAAGGFTALIAQTVQAAGRLDDLAKVTGISAGELAGMREAAARGGATIDEVAQTSVRFSKALATAGEESSNVSQVLKALGIGMEEIKSKAPVEQLHLVAQRMNEYQDGTGKAAAAQLLFGKSGAQLIPFLQELGSQQLEVVKGYDDFAAKADQLGDNLEVLKLRQSALVEQIAAGLLPALNAITGAFLDTKKQGEGVKQFWEGVGDIFRVVALGAKTLSTTITNVGVDLASMVETVKTLAGSANVAIGDFGKVRDALGEIWQNREAEIQKNTDALANFYAKISEGSPLLGTLAGDSAKLAAEHGKAAEGAKKQALALGELGESAKKATDPAQKFLEKLKEQNATLGLSEGALLRHQAAQLGVAKAAEPVIASIVKKKAELEAEKKALKQAEEEWAAYAKAQEEAIKKSNDILQAWDDGNKQLEVQIATLGKTKVEVERLAAAQEYEKGVTLGALIEETQARENYLEALEKQYKRRIELINSKEMREAELAAAADARKAWEDAAKGIETALEDAIFKGMKSGESMGKALRSSLDAMFKTLVLRPILQPISNMMASGMQGMMGMFSSMLGGGAGAAGGGGGGGGGMDMGGLMNLFSAFGGGGGGGGIGSMFASGAASLFGGSALGASGMLGMFNAFATSGMGAAMGLSVAGEAGLMMGTNMAAGSMLTTAGSTLAAAIPVIGWVIAAIALIASFASDRGGPKVGSWINESFTRGVSNNDYVPHTTSGGGDSNAMHNLLNTVNTGYLSALRAFGGEALEAYRIHVGYDEDPQGDAPSRGRIAMWRTEYDSGTDAGRPYIYDSGYFDPNETNFQLYASQAIIAALQASELPEYLADIFDLAVPRNFSQENVQDLLKFGAALKTMYDLMGRDLDADIEETITASRRTATETYFAQGEALRQMIAEFDGSAAAAENLATATANYYQAQVQLLAQIEQMRQSLIGQFGSWEQLRRNFQLDNMNAHGRRAYLEAEIQSSMAGLGSATDATQIQLYNQALLQSVQQLWQYLTPEERATTAGSRTGYIDQIMQLTTQRLAEAEQRIRDDPNAPQAIMRSAAEVIHQAGLDFVLAANRSNDAATAFRQGMDQRQEVDVHIFVQDDRLSTEVGGGGGGD